MATSSGRLAAQNFKKRMAREKADAQERYEAAIEGRYTCPELGRVVTLFKRGYAYGADPQRGVTQRDFAQRRFG